MPIVNVTWTNKQDQNVKNDFYDFTADLINRETGTDPNLIYVFIREIEEENTRKRGTVVFVELKSTGEKPRKIQLAVHKKLRELGFRVEVIDTLKDVESLIFELTCE